MKNTNIVIRVSEHEKEEIEKYIKSLPFSYSYRKWNISNFIMKLIHDEMYYNKSLQRRDK